MRSLASAMGRRLAILTASIFLLGNSQTALGQTTVSVANPTVSPSQIPFWIAHEQGLFAKRGVEVKILSDVGSRGIGDAVPFFIGGTPAIIERIAEGRDLKLVATLDTARATAQMMASRDIRSADGLRGKRVGVITVGTGYWILAIQALEHLGIDPKRDGITFVELGTVPKLIQALEDGAIDAVMMDPGQSAQLRDKGFSMILDMGPADILSVQTGLAVTGAYARQHPDVVEKVVAGLIDGFGFSLAQKNEEAVRKMLMTRLRISAPAAVTAGYEIFLTRANRKPYASIVALRNLQQVMALRDAAILNVKIDDLVDDSFVRKIDDSGAIDRLDQGDAVRKP